MFTLKIRMLLVFHVISTSDQTHLTFPGALFIYFRSESLELGCGYLLLC